MNIDIDLNVYKGLTALLRSEHDTYGAVIARLLVEHSHAAPCSAALRPTAGLWVRDGVRLLPGTRMRIRHKGTTHYAVIRNARIQLDRGQSFDAPSPAATAITKNSVNGWILWEAEDPEHRTWSTLDELRKRTRSVSAEPSLRSKAAEDYRLGFLTTPSCRVGESPEDPARFGLVVPRTQNLGTRNELARSARGDVPQRFEEH